MGGAALLLLLDEVVGVVSAVDNLLLETGDNTLLETGDFLLLEG